MSMTAPFDFESIIKPVNRQAVDMDDGSSTIILMSYDYLTDNINGIPLEKIVAAIQAFNKKKTKLGWLEVKTDLTKAAYFINEIYIWKSSTSNTWSLVAIVDILPTQEGRLFRFLEEKGSLAHNVDITYSAGNAVTSVYAAPRESVCTLNHIVSNAKIC